MILYIPKTSACYSCRGCHKKFTDLEFKPCVDNDCHDYLPDEPKNTFMDNIIKNWEDKHGKNQSRDMV